MKSVFWVLVAIIIIGGAFVVWQNGVVPTAPAPTGSPSDLKQVTPTPTPPAPTPASTPTPTPTPSTVVPMSATVTYNGSFSPQEVTIKKGGTLTWINNSDGQMWIASAQHPSHTGYSGTARTAHCPDKANTAFDQCAGETGNYSFTFQKTGSWGYHDHLMPSAFGRVEVVE